MERDVKTLAKLTPSSGGAGCRPAPGRETAMPAPANHGAATSVSGTSAGETPSPTPDPPAANRPPGVRATGQALIRLGARLYRLQVEALESLDEPLSVRQYRLLDRVDRGVRSLSEHASMARRRPSTISKSADSLVRRGLLLRAEAPEDRRVMILSLTPRGREALSRARSALDELASWLVGGMDERTLALTFDGALSLYERAEARVHSPLQEQQANNGR